MSRLLNEVNLDVRHAARMLITQPSFTGAAVLSLALGIGATTAIFSVVDAVLIDPLPYTEPDRLMAIHGTSSTSTTNPVSYPNSRRQLPRSSAGWRARSCRPCEPRGRR